MPALSADARNLDRHAITGAGMAGATDEEEVELEVGVGAGVGAGAVAGLGGTAIGEVGTFPTGSCADTGAQKANTNHGASTGIE
jgi:hypothetical protein